MEAAYQRYVALLSLYNQEPVSLEVFATSGLLSAFLSFESRSATFELPTGSRERGNHFGLYLRSLRATGGQNEDKAWQAYSRAVRRKPAKRKNPLSGQTSTPRGRPPVQRRPLAPLGSRDNPEVIITSREAILPELTEQQRRELDMAIHYRDNLPPGTLEAFVRVHGFNPLERYRVYLIE